MALEQRGAQLRVFGRRVFCRDEIGGFVTNPCDGRRSGFCRVGRSGACGVACGVTRSGARGVACRVACRVGRGGACGVACRVTRSSGACGVACRVTRGGACREQRLARHAIEHLQAAVRRRMHEQRTRRAAHRRVQENGCRRNVGGGTRAARKWPPPHEGTVAGIERHDRAAVVGRLAPGIECRVDERAVDVHRDRVRARR
jgi:hypothetical protein